VELAYDRRGSGEALVLLHSLGADRHVWSPVFDLLAAERDVIAVDLPGFGDSPAVTNGDAPSAEVMAAGVASFLDEIGVDRPHVAGNSLGGWVALQLALENRVRSVTAIAPAGLWSHPLGPKPAVGRAAARAAAPLLAPLLATEKGRRLALAGTMAHPERVPAREAVRLVRAYAAAPGYDDANAAMRAGRFTGIDRIRVPVTLAWPDRDRLVGRPAHLPPHVGNVVLRDCGHVPMWDDPRQVASVLLRGSAG
jgi:pimeloyl-ACP methyl ester carboxylesterase